MRAIRPFAFLLPLLLAATATAETLAPDEFEDLATGRTLWFSDASGAFGAEQYLPGRRSLWRYADGSCTFGTWWDEGDLVCFRYETDAGPQCWRFTRQGDRISAAHIGESGASGTVLTLERIDAQPLPCAGPEVGS